jgi:hypothetical protein
MQESISEGYSLKKQLYPTEVLTADEWGPESHLMLRSVIPSYKNFSAKYNVYTCRKLNGEMGRGLRSSASVGCVEFSAI